MSDNDISHVISYWFDAEDPVKKWFFGGDKVDAEIKSQFAPLVERARASELTSWTSWTSSPRGTLALLMLLDQFPRNLFRGSALSFSSDGMALDIATQALAKSFHRQVPLIQEPFFFLPLVHNETLLSQVAAVAFYESFASRVEEGTKEAAIARDGNKAAEGHRDLIMGFGRFPARNKALGRENTKEEEEFIREHPSGY